MKIIFLSVLAATTLSTLSSSLVFNSNANKELNVVENTENNLEEAPKRIMSGDYNDFWGSHDDMFNHLSGGWQCWENVFLYCDPANLVHKANYGYYELSTRLYITTDEWDKPTITYIGTANYTTADFFYDEVTFNQEESYFDVVFRTNNPSAEGEMYIYYTYYHYEEEPPMQNVPSTLWNAMSGAFDYLEGGEQVWNYVYLYAKPEKFTRYGQTNVYEMTADVEVPFNEGDKETVTYLGFENFTGKNINWTKVIFNPDTNTFNIRVHVKYTEAPTIQGGLYFFYTYYHFYEEQEDGVWPAPIESDGLVHESYADFHPEYVDYFSTGVKDNFPKGAVPMSADSFTMKGQICNYSRFVRETNNLEANDSDWYKFEVNPMSTTYHFTFQAPNKYYHLSVYKYSCVIDAYLDESDLTEIFELENGEDDRRLYTPGTYYVKVTCSAKRVSKEQYIAEGFASKTNNYFPLYKKSKKDYAAVVWENDYIPDCIEDRWSTNLHEIKTQDISPVMGANRSGYCDPIFYEPIIGHTKPFNKMILDSVIYIWGKDEIEVLAGALQKLKIGLKQLRRQQLRNQKIISDVSSITSGVFTLFLYAVGFEDLAPVGDAAFSADFEKEISTGDDGIDAICNISKAICDLILGSVPESVDDYAVLESAVSELIGICDGITGDPNGVVCIPVYGEMGRISIADSNTATRDVWVYKRSFVPWNEKLYNSGFNEIVTIPTNKFKFDRITEVQELGKVIEEQYVVQKTYHGVIKPFTSIEALKNYIRYDQIFDPNKIINS